MNKIMKADRAFFYGLVVLALGAFTFYISSSFPDLPEGHPGPGLFPRIIGACLALTGLGLIIFRKKQDVEDHSLDGQWLLVLMLLGIILMYPWLHRFAGFLVALAISVFGVALLLRIIWWKSLVIAVLTTAAIFLLFKQLLQVPL